MCDTSDCAVHQVHQSQTGADSALLETSVGCVSKGLLQMGCIYSRFFEAVSVLTSISKQMNGYALDTQWISAYMASRKQVISICSMSLHASDLSYGNLLCYLRDELDCFAWTKSSSNICAMLPARIAAGSVMTSVGCRRTSFPSMYITIVAP